MKLKTNWGIIGCGDVCEVKSGPAFSKVEHSALVAVMRRDGALAKDFAARHNVPRYYDDAQQLIDDEEVDAVYIATPPAYHEAYAIKAMAAGKPVYIEKPVATDAAAVERTIAAARQYNVPAVAAHYRRALPLFLKVRALVQENTIGDVRLILLRMLQPPGGKITTHTKDHWRVQPGLSGGGLFHDLAPHQLDILYWIFGAPAEVYGRSLNQQKRYEAPDVTALNALFDNNVYMQGLWSFNTPESMAEDSCRIVGDKGVISFSFFRNPVLEVTVAGEPVRRLEFAVPEHIQQPMIDLVVRYFRGEAPNPCSLEEALVSIRMMDRTK